MGKTYGFFFMKLCVLRERGADQFPGKLFFPTHPIGRRVLHPSPTPDQGPGLRSYRPRRRLVTVPTQKFYTQADKLRVRICTEGLLQSGTEILHPGGQITGTDMYGGVRISTESLSYPGTGSCSKNEAGRNDTNFIRHRIGEEKKGEPRKR